MSRVVRITGFKNGGKTSTLEGLVKELVDRNYEVGTIKHLPHNDFDIDKSGTDTWRHLEAGSTKTVALSPTKLITMKKKIIDPDKVLLSMMNLDFVIMEGFKGMKNTAKIVVAEDKSEAETLKDEFTICFIGQGKGETPILEKGNYSDLADLVENKAVMPVGNLQCGKCGYETCREFVLASIRGEASKEGCVALKGALEITVDGKEVPLKPFVEDLLLNILTGAVSSLKGTEGREIEIKIRKDEG